MDLAELKIFKAVAEQGGINKAAAALNRVQSNVTSVGVDQLPAAIDSGSPKDKVANRAKETGGARADDTAEA